MTGKKGWILFNQGPWGGGGGGNSPWGQKPGRGPANDPPPDLDKLLRDAHNRFRNTIRGGGGGAHGGGRGLGFLFIAVVALWLVSGFYRVQPSEHAVILTFGKWTSTRTEPGLGYRAPWPFQQVRKVDIALDRRVAVGFRDTAPSRSSGPGQSDVPEESLMVTGDENIINIDFVVLWHIGDAGKYLFEIREPERTIKKVAESAMREIIGRTEIQKALTESRAEIEARTKDLMQHVLDSYLSGIIVDNVQLLNVEPPAAVVDAFDDVQRARADKERAKNEADAYMNDIVPRARGEAKKMLQAAEAYKEAVISRAQGDAQRFLSVYDAYRQSKDVTQKRMYIETMQEIMQNSKKVIVGDKGAASVLPYLPLDRLQPGKKE